LVGMTRANIADQQLPEKAERGEVERIRPCVALNVCWRTSVANGLPITCAVNPTAGREEIWGEGTLPRAGEPRRVVAAGGGPAGLEAARVLAAAGHEVVLLERSGRLGGQMALAAVAPGRADLQAWVVPAHADVGGHRRRARADQQRPGIANAPQHRTQPARGL